MISTACSHAELLVSPSSQPPGPYFCSSRQTLVTQCTAQQLNPKETLCMTHVVFRFVGPLNLIAQKHQLQPKDSTYCCWVYGHCFLCCSMSFLDVQHLGSDNVNEFNHLANEHPHNLVPGRETKVRRVVHKQPAYAL